MAGFSKLLGVHEHILKEPRFLKSIFKCLILDDTLLKNEDKCILDLLDDLYFYKQLA